MHFRKKANTTQKYVLQGKKDKYAKILVKIYVYVSIHFLNKAIDNFD